MDKKAKVKWIRALRSGKYQRTRGQLKDGSAYCCLGVLCEVLGQSYSPDEASLDLAFRDRLGISAQMESALIGLNDGCFDSLDVENFGKPPRGYKPETGSSFLVIADWISAHAKETQ